MALVRRLRARIHPGYRPRSKTGRILDWHVNVPPVMVEMTCIICGKITMVRKWRLRPGQQTTSCGPACRDLAMMLWPLETRRSAT